MHSVVGNEVEETLKLLMEPFSENLIDEEVAQSSCSNSWPDIQKTSREKSDKAEKHPQMKPMRREIRVKRKDLPEGKKPTIPSREVDTIYPPISRKTRVVKFSK